MSTPVATVTFQRERIRECQDEIQPLLVAHWREIAAYQDIPLDPDWVMYRQIEATGALRIYTVRDESMLVGYAVFFVRSNPHYKGSVQATQDILYLDPPFRKQRVGATFIEWCDAELRKEGVQVVYHHVKLAFDFGPLLERLGYEALEKIYARRLDRS